MLNSKNYRWILHKGARIKNNYEKFKGSFLDSIPWLKSHRPPLIWIYWFLLNFKNLDLLSIRIQVTTQILDESESSRISCRNPRNQNSDGRRPVSKIYYWWIENEHFMWKQVYKVAIIVSDFFFFFEMKLITRRLTFEFVFYFFLVFF